MATSDENKAKFNQYYSLRSKIVHTGKHMISEKLFSEISKADRDTDFLTQIEVIQLSKLAITNWLLIKRSEK